MKREISGKGGGMRRKKRDFMTDGQYRIVADIVRQIEDVEIKQAVANHFSTELNKRSKSFDPQIWYEATGGLPAADSAA